MITVSFHDRDYVKIIFVILVAIFVIASTVHIVIDISGNNQNNEVYEKLDRNGGMIYLDIPTGSGALSAQNWYVPQESDVVVENGYIHLNKAKTHSYVEQTYNLYIPLDSVLYVVTNGLD